MKMIEKKWKYIEIFILNKFNVSNIKDFKEKYGVGVYGMIFNTLLDFVNKKHIEL